MVTCGFCRRDFEVDRAQPACQGCPLARACRAVRCPHCGYENPIAPPLPGWLARLRHFANGLVAR